MIFHVFFSSSPLFIVHLILSLSIVALLYNAKLKRSTIRCINRFSIWLFKNLRHNHSFICANLVQLFSIIFCKNTDSQTNCISNHKNNFPVEKKHYLICVIISLFLISIWLTNVPATSHTTTTTNNNKNFIFVLC